MSRQGPRHRLAEVASRDVALDGMLEERDHLKIRLNLLEDPDVTTHGSIAETHAQLAELERRIQFHRRAALGGGA